MTRFAALLAIASILAPIGAQAKTYTFDFGFREAPENNRFHRVPGEGAAPNAPLVPADADQSLRLTGQIETDGTLGLLTGANFTAWNFTLNGVTGVLDFGTDMTPSADGLNLSVTGNFRATNNRLRPTGAFSFLAWTEGVDETNTYDLRSGFLFGDGGSTRLFAEGRSFTIDCGVIDCPVSDCGTAPCPEADTVRFNERGFITRDADNLTPVPVPPALPMLAAGILGLAYFRRRIV